jgi:hypothetical protein
MARRFQRDERGSALVLALVALAFFALMLTATLAATETGLHLAQTNKSMPPKLYGADGAIDSAIQQMRGDASIGSSGDTDCGPNSAANGQLHVTANGQEVYVQCQGLPGSGELLGGGSSPTLGILTLATGSEVGYRQGGNAIVRLDGGLYSNSSISFDQGSTCDGSNPTCSQLNLCPKNGRTVTDASYATNSFNITSNTARFIAGDLGSVLKGPGIPAGATIKTVISTTQVALDKKPDANSAPAGSTITFREFPFSQTACHPPAGTKGNITVVGSPCGTAERIVAVTKSGSCGTDAGPPSSVGQDPLFDPDQQTGFVDRTVPACGSAAIVDFQPGKYVDGAGLTSLAASCSKLFWFHPGTYYFEFDTEWSLSNSNLTVVAGDKSWDSRGVISGSINNNNTTVTCTGCTFTSADVGKFINSGNSLVYGTYIASYVNATTVTISANPLSAASWFTVGSSKSMCVEGDNNEPGAQFIFGRDSRLKLTDGRFEICAPAWTEPGHQRIGVFGVKTPRGVLQGPPAPPATPCTQVIPYPSASACARVNVSGPRSVFLVHGTIYTPGSPIDLTLSNVGYQIVSRGIISRVLSLGISPSADYTDPVIYSPDFGSTIPDDRRVLITACLSAPCGSAGSKAIIKAVVQFVDSDPLNDFASVSPGFDVKVRSWTVIR